MWELTDDKALKENAFQVCKDFLEGPWQNISLQDFQFSVVSGGMCNHLYKCSLPENLETTTKAPNEVLLRIYGSFPEDTDVILRDAIIFVILSEKKLGPKLYGVFPSGRLEQYIPSRSLNGDDFKGMSTVIAKEMARIHALQVPIKKRPTELILYMKNWLNFVEQNIDSPKVQSSIRHLFFELDIQKEIEWLNYQMEKTESPVVFSHNDLQGGNILLRNGFSKNTDGCLLFIDFEFSSYNYRGFDIANHFCEWCFDYNTKEFPHFLADLKKFPTEAEQEEFIKAYLNQMTNEGVFLEDSFDFEQKKQKILKEVTTFKLASHMLWATWSFKMALSSSILFSYWEYGKTRLDAYKQCKEEFLSKELDTHVGINNWI